MASSTTTPFLKFRTGIEGDFEERRGMTKEHVQFGPGNLVPGSNVTGEERRVYYYRSKVPDGLQGPNPPVSGPSNTVQ